MDILCTKRSMNKYIMMLAVLLLVVGIVSASTDCSSYFSKSESKRMKSVSAISSIVASTDRLSSATDKFYNVLDDMHSSDNLTDASEYFSDFVNDKNDVSDDVSSLKDAIGAYDSAIRDDYSDLPTECRSLYYSYSSNYDDMDTYYRHIKSSWTTAVTKYDVIYGYYANLDNHRVSDIKTYVDNIRDSISKVSSDAQDASDEIDKSNFDNVSTTMYNQSECYQYVAASMDTVKSQMTSLCKRQLDNATKNCNAVQTSCPVCQTCPVCQSCQSCDLLVKSVQDQYSQCQSQLSAIQSQLSTQSTVSQLNCASVNDQNAQLQKQLQDANAMNDNLTTQLKKQGGTACPQCQSCLLYQLAALGLLLLIIAAWIFTL